MRPIRGQTRTLPSPIKANVRKRIAAKANIHNRFDIEVVDTVTGEVRQRAQAENVILNNCFTHFTFPWNNAVFYGSGSGTPAATDTNLFTYVGYKATTVVYGKYSDDYTSYMYQRTCQLTTTDAVGVTISEIGIADKTNNYGLMTHAMLKDANGNTITITKTSTDIINIYATVFASAGVSSAGVHLTGVLPYLVGAPLSSSDLSSTAFSYGDYLRLMIGGNILASIVPSRCTMAISGKTLSISGQPKRCKASSGNGPSITGVSYLNMFFNVEDGTTWFTPSKITGEAIGTGDGSKVDFSTAFSLAHDATIYIDGVAQSGVTVDSDKYMGQAIQTYAENYFVQIAPVLPVRYIVGGGFGAEAGKSKTLYNPFYSFGIKQYNSDSGKVEASNDLINWVTISERTSTSTTTITVLEAYRYYKYWRITGIGGNSTNVYNLYSVVASTPNIHFSAPPASGAVITADYTPHVIGKDTNHVFDFSLSITLNEAST